MLLSALLTATAFATVSIAAPAYEPLPSTVRLQKMTNSIKNQANLAPVSAHLTNYGGPVIPNVEVHPIYYGNANYQSNLDAFYAGVTNSAWMDVMNQYGVYRGTAVKGFGVPATKSSLDDVADIQKMLIDLVKGGTIRPTANTYYPIHFAPGISISQGGSASCKVFCAYHGTIDVSSLNVGAKYLYYGVMPDQGGACAGGCGSNAQTVNNLFSVSSHELCEAATDAAVGLATVIGAPLAWYDQTNGENGDICNAQQGTTVGGDGVTYVVQKHWSNADNACLANKAGVPQTTTTTTTTTKVATTTKAATTTTTTTTTKAATSTKGTTTTTTTTTTKKATTTGSTGGPVVGGPCTQGVSQCSAGTMYYCQGSKWIVWYTGC
ncbi:hypothetical protein BDR26DRAFT_922768 [Obelidium mucronatum]|nr:hypothetical protein BDR26DRAFT_922768 [Obelidium mucronatum]